MAYPVTASPSSWHQSEGFAKSSLLPGWRTEAGKHELRGGRSCFGSLGRRGCLNLSGNHNKSQRKSEEVSHWPLESTLHFPPCWKTPENQSLFCKTACRKTNSIGYFGVWSGGSDFQSSLKGYSRNISIGSVGRDKRKEPRSPCSQLTSTERAGSRAKAVGTVAVFQCEGAKTWVTKLSQALDTPKRALAKFYYDLHWKKIMGKCSSLCLKIFAEANSSLF